jgi:hypothetical protein
VTWTGMTCSSCTLEGAVTERELARAGGASTSAPIAASVPARSPRIVRPYLSGARKYTVQT